MRARIVLSMVVPIAVQFALVATGAGQTVRGTVVDDLSDEPVTTAEVAVIDGEEHVVARSATDEEGRFEVQVPDEASYQLRVSRLGYATAISTSFSIPDGRVAYAELRLGILPLELEPIVAVVDGEFERLARGGFYTRVQDALGYFLTPKDMDTKAGLITLDDLFQRAPGVDVRFEGSRTSFDVFTGQGVSCRMSVAIDGIVVQMGGRGREPMYWSNMVTMVEVAAVEVYVNRAGVPEWMRGHRAECGAVVIWTKGFIGKND